jgi:phosphatidylserine/phosphatidylglycerophosphate/cardiolipin synthase-like enzyme
LADCITNISSHLPVRDSIFADHNRVESAQLFAVHAEGLQAQTRYAEHPKCPTAWGDLAVTLAGPCAESIFACRNLLDVLNDGAQYKASDLQRAQREARRLHRLRLYRSPDHALFVAETRARTMLTAHWQFVVSTARKLYNEGRIK